MPGNRTRQTLLPQATNDATAQGCGPVVVLGSLLIVASAGLIAFNKSLMRQDRFPFPVALVMCHTAFCFVMCSILLRLRPSLFPSLTEPMKRIALDRDLIIGVLPIATCFTGQLVLSNMAFMHSSVSFLQFMKEGNVVLVYGLSVVAGLEALRGRQVALLLGIVAATAMTFHGEANFAMTGFLFQLVCCGFESCKIVLQGVLLSGAGKRLDALSYVLVVTPLCLMLLGCVTCWDALVMKLPGLAVPTQEDFARNAKPLLANTVLAFLLNVVIALFIKHSSAVSFVMVGIVKDVVIVSACSMLLQESISGLQVSGFCLQLFMIFVWSMTKTFPEKFERGILPGLGSLFLRALGAPDYNVANQVDSKKEAAAAGASAPAAPATATGA